MDDTSAFAEELEDVALQLASLDPFATSPEAMAATAERAIAEYERLSMTAALYNADGVQQTATWILGLLNSFRDTLPEAILELLQGGQLFNWIELTAAVLQTPEDDSTLPPLNAALLDEAWPEPIPAAALQALLLSLRLNQTPELNLAEPLATNEPLVTDTAASASVVPNTETSGNTTPTATALTWDADIHPELLAAYLQETPAQISEAARLIRLIATGSSTAEQKRHAARLAHTVKGASGVVGIAPIAEFTHRLEDILDLNIAPHLAEGLGATLEAAADCLETLFEHLQERKPLPDEYQALLAALDDWEQRLAAQQTANDSMAALALAEAETEALRPTVLNLPDFIVPEGTPTDTTEVTPSETTRSSYLNVPMATVERLLSLAGELITSTSQIAEHAQQTLAFGKQLQQQDEHIRQMLEELGTTIDQQARDVNAQRAQHSDFDQLELEAYNDLHSANSLLTEAIADNRELTRNLQNQIRQISDQVYQQQRLQRQLSDMILGTRLVPVQSIVARVERTVRETCRRTDKQAEIHIHGQQLHIDTDMLNGLTAPLLHMLRNAVDHGIESPEQRSAHGKAPVGRIDLTFAQQGNQIHLTLRDDGQGIDPERIRARAVERGLIHADADLTEAELLRLILRPGFTTRDQVSDISGRGVGMDVVQTAVENLQGTLQIESTVGQGTTIHIQVPLTLIATNALLVRAGGHLIAIPSNTVLQLLYVAANEHIQEDGKWYISYQGKQHSVHLLAHLLGWHSEMPNLNNGYSLLLVAQGQKLYPLYVEEILQPRDVVVKSLAPWLNLPQGISGACILANGAVAPVLDTARLLRNFENGTLPLQNAQQANAATTLKRPHILIVDDSLSNRKALSLMVEQMGYQSITAIDGLDALQQLHEQPIALVLTDLEMPRMNGLEMAQAIRIWPEKRHIPIIMITSRSTQKHRSMAQQAGIDDYLTKPVNQDTLHTQVHKWLSTPLAA